MPRSSKPHSRLTSVDPATKFAGDYRSSASLRRPQRWSLRSGLNTLMMTMDRLHIPIRAKIIGPPCSAARVTKCAAVWTFSILCSDFGISFASHAMASARVLSFRPSGNSIGSSKRRDQDTTQTPQTKNAPILCRLSDRPIPTPALEFDCPRCLELNALPPQGSVSTGFDPQTVGSHDPKGQPCLGDNKPLQGLFLVPSPVFIALRTAGGYLGGPRETWPVRIPMSGSARGTGLFDPWWPSFR